MDVGFAVLDENMGITKRSLDVDFPVGCQGVPVGAVVGLHLQVSTAAAKGVAADRQDCSNTQAKDDCVGEQGG